ncbi:hypothetical protein HPB48_008471 [Haemaphysalis longicornis]|uniref:Ig-like domain-containing protein n=1 Tax=Haemaphysalis longicornis TaxID=44386 RepID=A0A9J6FN44_HAELO|nr:hypothetical protein HPB48_008471 [Haemaphysalis longicornis]
MLNSSSSVPCGARCDEPQGLWQSSKSQWLDRLRVYDVYHHGDANGTRFALLCALVANAVAHGTPGFRGDPPRVQPFSFPVIKQTSKKVTVHCAVFEGSEPLEFVWLKDGVKIGASRRLQVKQISEIASTLTIPEVGAEDIANYTCAVSNAAGSDSVTSQLVVTYPPRLQPFAFPKDHLPGQTLAVTCIASQGAQPLHFAWLKDGRPFAANGRKAISKMVTESVSVLTVTDVGPADIGNYTCRATNAAGSDSFTAPLVVSATPVIMPFSFAKDVTLGEKTLLTCAVTRGTEPFHFRWTQDGEPVANTVNKYATSVTENIATMTIEKVAAEDVGNYTCTVTNEVGRDAVTAALVVREPPQIQPFAFPKNPPLNSNMVISCNAHIGTEPINFVWFKDGQELPSASKVNAKIISETVSILTVPRVSPEDVGNYTCKATNRFGEVSFTAPLLPTEPPQIQPFVFPKNSRLNSKITISCSAHIGTEPLSFAWFKNGRELRPENKASAKMASETVSMLTIPNVSPDDVGNYTCQASNQFGTDSYTATLLLTATLPSFHRTHRTQCIVKTTKRSDLLCIECGGVTGRNQFLSSSLYNIPDLPKIQPFSFPRNHPIGKDVTVSCFATEGQPPFAFTWLKDEREVASGSKFTVKYPVEKMSMLIIHEVSAVDIGNYTCQVSNDAGSDRFTASLTVTEPPKIQPFSFANDEQLGKEVTVSCVAVRGHQPLRFKWLKNGIATEGDHNIGVEEIAGKISTLTIRTLSAADFGNYTCRVSNAAGADEFTAALVVNEPPKIQPFFFANDEKLGKEVTVSCFAVRGHQPFRFKWLKNGIAADGDPNVGVEEIAGKISALTIRKLSAADFGNYTCRVSNAAGADEFTTALVVNGTCSTWPSSKGETSFAIKNAVAQLISGLHFPVEAPKIQPFSFPTSRAMPKKVVVHCVVVEGSEPLQFSWMRDGARIETNARVQVTQVSEAISKLTISRAGAEDIGNYTCVVKNAAGSDRVTSELLVNGTVGFPWFICSE